MIQRGEVCRIDRCLFRSIGTMNPYIKDTDERRNVRPEDFLLYGDYLYTSLTWEEYVYGDDFDL